MPTRRATGWAVQRYVEISELGAATELSQIQPSDEKGTPAIDINRLAWLKSGGAVAAGPRITLHAVRSRIHFRIIG